jgi:hypothetical protein
VNLQLSSNDVQELANLTPGYSYAEVRKLAKTAAIICHRHYFSSRTSSMTLPPTNMSHFHEALKRISSISSLKEDLKAKEEEDFQLAHTKKSVVGEFNYFSSSSTQAIHSHTNSTTSTSVSTNQIVNNEVHNSLSDQIVFNEFFTPIQPVNFNNSSVPIMPSVSIVLPSSTTLSNDPTTSMTSDEHNTFSATCPLCKKTFEVKQLYNNHLSKGHKRSCILCELRFVNSEQCDVHLKEDHGIIRVNQSNTP